MGNEALRDLVGQLRGRKLNRRQFMTRAAAAGVSATAISGALRSFPTRAQSAVEVQFWTTFSANDLANVQAVVDAYNAQASGSTVKVVQVPPAQVTDVTKLLTAVRGGTGPDMYHLDRFIVAQNAATGVLQDLSSMGADLSPYISFAKEEATFDGKAYALPFDTDARALYYNKKMISAAGFDPAELDSSKGPITWDRVAEIAAKIDQKDSNGNYSQMGFVPWDNQGWHYTYGFSWGGKFFDQAACEVSPTDTPIVAAFQWVQDYCNNLGADKVSAFANAQNLPGANPSENTFYTEKLAMTVTGDWQIASIPQYNANLDYGIAWMPVPKAGDNSVTWAGGWSAVIPQGAKHVEEALTAMQFICGEAGQRIYTQKSAHLPTWQSLLSDKELFAGAHSFFSEILPSAKNRPPLPVGAKYWDELTVAWQKTYLDQGKPEDLLKDAKDHVDADLKQYCPITIEEGTPTA